MGAVLWVSILHPCCLMCMETIGHHGRRTGGSCQGAFQEPDSWCQSAVLWLLRVHPCHLMCAETTGNHEAPSSIPRPCHLMWVETIGNHQNVRVFLAKALSIGSREFIPAT